MVKEDTLFVRPRKPISWASETVRQKTVPIFRLGENDFTATAPHSNLNLNAKDHLSISNPRPIYPKKISVNVKKTVVNQLQKYCENTTLHGLRYVADTHLSFGERIFWLISFSLAIGFAAYFISNIYVKWKSSPVIISFSPFDADLSSIPFPAVTICNMNQAKKSQAEEIIKHGSIVDKKLLDDSCNGNTTFDSTENIKWETLRNFLVRVGNSCTDILKLCQWGSQTIDCEDVFNNDLTDEGLCCSFNRLPPQKIFRNLKDISILNQTYPENVYDWNAEKGFKDMKYGEYIPRRPLGAGAHLGLTVILDAQVDNYYCSSTRSTGFKVILSNPIETPKMADFGFLISPGLETRVTIEPSIREATSSLRSVPIINRQCYFSNERPLQYYRTYTQRNCLQECQSNYTLRECNCIPYYLPKNNLSPYCGNRSNVNCTRRVKVDITNIKNGSYLDGDCQCKPACFEIIYKQVSSEVPLWPSNFNGYSVTLNDTRRTYSQQNCLLECQSNYTLNSCRCVPYYLPKNSLIKYCGKIEKQCVEQAKIDMETVEGNGSSCLCLPSCHFVEYSESKSYAKLSKEVSNDVVISSLSKKYFIRNMAVVQFFFYNSKFTKELKSELYGFTEILCNKHRRIAKFVSGLQFFKFSGAILLSDLKSNMPRG
ncbi:pickpocket protein 28-like [Euwallacea similis]|uniref:pickpocket protein 28-like n=1 Tax=Euwallacea similis TaxID=1736056 RepID=UPI00344F4B39